LVWNCMEKLYGKDHPYVAYTLRILSSIYEGQGKYRQARPVLDRAMTIMNSYHLPDDQIMAPFYVDIAKLLAAQGHFAQAEGYYEQALALINKSYGANHLYTAGVLGGMASMYALQGEYTKAEELINQTLAAQEKVYGPEHHLLVPTWLTMARIYQEKKDYIQAEKLLQKALAVVREKRGIEHPATGRVLNILGELYILEGRYAEAGGVSLGFFGGFPLLPDYLGVPGFLFACGFSLGLGRFGFERLFSRICSTTDEH